MAMGRRGRDAAERAIANCQSFQNSTGSLRGTRGNTRNLGWLSSHRDAARIQQLLLNATYVVWSYETPIGWVTEDETGNVTFYYVEVTHTTTTNQHQSVLRTAWGEYETIGEPVRRRREPSLQSSMQAAFAPGAFNTRLQPPTSGARMDFSGQDELMDEVRGYRHPSHP